MELNKSEIELWGFKKMKKCLNCKEVKFRAQNEITNISHLFDFGPLGQQLGPLRHVSD